jgi:hypothetical protein
MTLTEAMVEEAALGWFQELGYAALPGTTLSLGDPTAGDEALGEGGWRGDCGGCLLLNPATLRNLPAETPVAPD